MASTIARLRAWLLEIVREAVRLELVGKTFRDEIQKPAVVSIPVSKPVTVIPDTFEAERDAAIKSCEVEP